MEEFTTQLDLCMKELSVVELENISSIESKVKNTGISVELKSTSEYEERINEIISKANENILKFNDKIEQVQDSMKSVKNRFWMLMREDYDSVIELYKATVKRQDTYVSEYRKQLDIITLEKNKQMEIIVDNQKKTVNIDEAVDNIKQGLIDIGITGFTLEKYSDEEALYHLKRDNDSGNVFKTLSEGEKMVISFLYFVELCKGESRTRVATSKKIIVIDDPIYNLSHIYVFNIGRVIHNEFLKKKYEQIFVLIHSLYFFYELTNTKHDEREETLADKQIDAVYSNNQSCSVYIIQGKFMVVILLIPNHYERFFHRGFK